LTTKHGSKKLAKLYDHPNNHTADPVCLSVHMSVPYEVLTQKGTE